MFPASQHFLFLTNQQRLTLIVCIFFMLRLKRKKWNKHEHDSVLYSRRKRDDWTELTWYSFGSPSDGLLRRTRNTVPFCDCHSLLFRKASSFISIYLFYLFLSDILSPFLFNQISNQGLWLGPHLGQPVIPCGKDSTLTCSSAGHR